MNPSQDITCYLCEREAAEDCEVFCNAVLPLNAVLDIEAHDREVTEVMVSRASHRLFL